MSPHTYTGTRLEGKAVLEARVPSEIHKVLAQTGHIGDPNYGLNSLGARWVEEMFWIYRRTFEVPVEATTQRAWLTFDAIELVATVFLNGEQIGQHRNALRPARFDVTGRLREGENLLVVQVESGLHAYADKPAGEYGTREIHRLTKRPFMRHPMYQHGWDWNPRLLNIGIVGGVRLEWRDGPWLDQVTVYAVPTSDLQKATVHVRATVDNSEGQGGATLRARVVETGQEVSALVAGAPAPGAPWAGGAPSISEGIGVAPFPGERRAEVLLEIDHPRLWWPNGHGEQALYTVEVALEAAGEIQQVTRKTGVRLVEIDQRPHPIEGRYFNLRINGRPIFCKGGDWSPADVLYTEVEDERYRRLIQLAVDQNFNFMRVNGVGPYVTHALAEACDQGGIMLWHDLPWGNAKFPMDEPEYLLEARREVTRAVRELANHPSIILWCGNNEIEIIEWRAGFDDKYRTHPHWFFFHHDVPAIIHWEDGSKLYWPTSPWSPDFHEANDPTIGNQHPWGVSLRRAGPVDWWPYRQYVDRFAVEGGVLGASTLATIREQLPESERRLHSLSWEHHDNTFAGADRFDPGALGHSYTTVEFWTGLDARELSVEEYAYVSGLLQAEGLTEYVNNYRRRMFSSAAAVFWSYNDAWPVVNGWTTVDYWLRKKLSYHPVRRAFQPVTVVVAEEGDQVGIYGVNDGPEAWQGEVRYGLFTLGGLLSVDRERSVDLPANTSTLLGQVSRAEWEGLGTKRSGAFAVLTRGGRAVAQHRLFVERFRDLELLEPKISLSRDGTHLTLISDVFAWGVCLDLEGNAPVSDNCFDLLPGIPYTIAWDASLGEPRVVKLGNRDAFRPR